MADDNINTLIANYKDMSMEELGSSLLARQARVRKGIAKGKKKSDRTAKIIAGVLAGQTIFNNAFNSRVKELATNLELDKVNDKAQVERTRKISQVLSYLPTGDEYTTAAQVKADPIAYDKYKTGIANMLIPQWQKAYAGSGKENEFLTISSSVRDAIDKQADLMLDYFYEPNAKFNKRTPREVFLTGSRDLLGGELSEEEIHRMLLNFETGDLAVKKAAEALQMKADYRGKTGIVSLFKNLRNVQDHVGYNDRGLFRSLDDETLTFLPKNFSDAMSHIRIDKFMTPDHNLLYDVKNSTENWERRATANPELLSLEGNNRFGTAANRLLQKARKKAGCTVFGFEREGVRGKKTEYKHTHFDAGQLEELIEEDWQLQPDGKPDTGIGTNILGIRGVQRRWATLNERLEGDHSFRESFLNAIIYKRGIDDPAEIAELRADFENPQIRDEIVLASVLELSVSERGMRIQALVAGDRYTPTGKKMEGVSGAFPSAKEDWEYDFTQIDALTTSPFRYGKGGQLQVSDAHKKLATIDPDLALAQVVNQLDDFLKNRDLDWSLNKRKQAIEAFMTQYGTEASTFQNRYKTIEEFLDDYYSGGLRTSMNSMYSLSAFTS